jgi:hypothetical protein
VKRTILAISACLGILPSSAYAVDWALNSTLTETVEANDNPFLRAVAAGAFNSYSSIAVDAVARTPTSKFAFDGNVNYRKYWGPGIETPGAQSESLGGSAKLHYETHEKYSSDSQYLDAGWHRQSTQFALLGELGVVTPTRGFLDTTTAAGGIQRSLTNLDTINLSAQSAYTSYDPGTGGTPFTNTSAVASWQHRVSPITSLSASSEVDRLHFDNALNTNITILRELAGLDTSFSRRLSFHGTAGVAYVQTENGSPAFSLSPSLVGADSSASDFVANLFLAYKMFSDTTLTLNAAQTIAPSAVGTLIKTTSVGSGLAYLVNSRETLSFAANASQTTSSGTQSRFLSASVTNSYQLTRQWTAQLSYRYLHRLATSGTASTGFVVDPVTGIPLPVTSGLGPASSNSVMLVVSRSVSILPDGN